ncbi:Asp-tRNAAsn/Glu-tRNAGln amidotransferase A subunit or related amidase [Geosmithia morbida]|uniref:Asp-tRNAAsn/Glu-tRNAGln amidotransferase A subunit or related amidase n=1 Tax=Geosmithia morbida TaxID=1094350 RepID=A0A9P4YPL4_9HYPO|nr:Asp-tRNAAsn/Glu-tRNAGln amidotransferase A subunit or related amidase [Geosmithia morbida]KAF4119482.1 Asp-tRNAAsn/Glu-tRNAGln amidotransferase A subunit or related amidase [Geosmithia morbida]
MTTLSIVEASIDDLKFALSSGSLTSVDLVARYLRRIARYDCRGPSLNAVPILNERVFDEAGKSDDRRAAGKPELDLEGIPFTVKDSYKVKGMTVASGSPAFENLVANDNAFTVSAIKNAGGIVLGRTNMPPMAYGGMQRGIYGRAESPYNPKYLAAAFASGSSNGSAVSTATSMAAFGMAEETVSSGRSPASNNALVAYTPSRGWISIRGNWPLYPTCDVVVPHTRSMDDMLTLLKVITADDLITEGDFWRDQPFISLEKPWGGKHLSPTYFRDMAKTTSLKGLRIAVPTMYIGGEAPDGATPVETSAGVIELWEGAKKNLEALGAEVIEVPDFPAVTAYEHPDIFISSESAARLPHNWNWYERGPLVAHGWDKFLRSNQDPNCCSLSDVKDEFEIFPLTMRGPAEYKHLPTENSLHWGKLAGYVQENPSMYELENLEEAVKALEAMRKQLFDDYLEQLGCDMFAFPACGDVAEADADVNEISADLSWKNGVFYSNGNRALRHLGIPSVTVPMGVLADKKIPVGLMFLGRAYEDENLLRWANAFEKKTRLRESPIHTPALESDTIPLNGHPAPSTRAPRPILMIEKCSVSTHDQSAGILKVEIQGTIEIVDGLGDAKPVAEVIVDGQDVSADHVAIKKLACGEAHKTFELKAWTLVPKPLIREGWEKTRAPIAGEKTIVVVLARSCAGGLPSGYLGLV